MGHQEEFSADLLQLYYDRLFPYEQMAAWLSYGEGEDYLIRREFSFTLENDTYIRYKAFANAEDMKSSMTKTLPFKIDIGAVFSVSPADKAKVSANDFTPEQRELVFDIDLTDYDDIRTCCEGASICNKCWRFMVAAVKVMEKALQDDFGFKHIMWVYSGRRGIHCWVCDETARHLTNDARTAVVQYLSLVEGNENVKRKVALKNPLHPSLERAVQILEPLFEEIIIDETNGQGILREEQHWSKLLAMIPDEDIRHNLHQQWSATNCSLSGMEKWNQVTDAVETAISKLSNSLKRAGAKHAEDRKRLEDLRTCLQEIVCSYLYPRLDANVSKQRNHLLKSPFAVHPKTGRVCVPIDATRIDDFNPFEVPTLGQLQQDLNASESKPNSNSSSPTDEDKENSRSKKHVAQSVLMNQYVKLMELTLLKPLAQVAVHRKRDRQEADAAITGDW